MCDTVAAQVRRAVCAIKSGGVVAYPTESCFGLGCNPKDPAAVKRILSMKNRSSAKGLILIGSEISQFLPYFDTLADKHLNKLEKSWPAAITWLVPAAHATPRWLSGISGKIAVRIPDHFLARQLCHLCGHALVSTSANQAGRKPCRSAEQVKSAFSNGPDVIIQAACGGLASPSRVIDLNSDLVVR